MSYSSGAHASASSGAPLGIKVIAVLRIIFALFGIIGSFALLSSSSPLLGLFILVLSIVDIAIAIGLLTLQAWAWYLAMFFYALSFVLDLIQFNIFGAIFVTIIAIYVFSKQHHYL